VNAEVRLDPRSHTELVLEARRRIELACPELMVNGGPDPAATLVELFAWMTDLVIERLGRVPDKLHIALLELLGISQQGPAAARTQLRLRLSAPASQPLEVRAGTEAGTLRTAARESVVFQVQDDFTIMPLRPAAYVVERAGAHKEVGIADGVAYPHGPDQLPFARPPQAGDALYLGFEQSVARLVVSVEIEASMARGAGVKPEDPPLRWEASLGDGEWAELEVLDDLTGGFNYGSGAIELQCAEESGIEPIAGRRLHWLRCRIAETTRIGGEKAVYTNPPEIYQITAAPIGALVPAEHSVMEIAEQVGASDGSPAQTFPLRFGHILALRAGETLEVQTPGGDWEPWEERDTLADSEARDRHFTLEPVSGTVRFGDGEHGAIPRKTATIRASSYRHGGGRAGNVAATELSTLRSAIPGVASVTNPEPALGGIDPQSIDALRSRAALEIRTRYRAVTAEDYEFLAAEATPRVARAHRVADDQPGVTLRILPRVDPAEKRLSIAELTPDQQLLDEVDRYLAARKLIGCPVRLAPMRFRAVSVVVNLQVSPRADVRRIEREVRTALYTYLNPLIGGGLGQGWPVGRSLNQGELYAIVHGFEGVEFVKVLRLYEMDLLTGKQEGKAAGKQIVIEPDEVIASGDHLVRVVRREQA
jgi:predicted phage baseplate assembly protein